MAQFIIPSIWGSGRVTAEELRKSYIKDVEGVYNNFAKERGAIRVMTYNVHYWTDPYSKEINHAEITKMIRALDPDVIGLQEVIIPGDKETDSHSTYGWTIKNTFGPLEREYNVHACRASKVMSRGKTGFGNVLATKCDGHIDTLTLPGNGEARSAVIGKLALGIVVCVVHLDVGDRTGDTRRHQISTVMKYLDERYPDSPKMMIGDFNCLRHGDYTDDDLVWINDNSPDTADYDTTKLIEKNGYRDLFAGECKYSVWTGRRVDYMFVKDFSYDIVDARVVYTPASDHLPLFVDLRKK